MRGAEWGRGTRRGTQEGGGGRRGRGRRQRRQEPEPRRTSSCREGRAGGLRAAPPERVQVAAAETRRQEPAVPGRRAAGAGEAGEASRRFPRIPRRRGGRGRQQRAACGAPGGSPQSGSGPGPRLLPRGRRFPVGVGDAAPARTRRERSVASARPARGPRDGRSGRRFGANPSASAGGSGLSGRGGEIGYGPGRGVRRRPRPAASGALRGAARARAPDGRVRGTGRFPSAARAGTDRPGPAVAWVRGCGVGPFGPSEERGGSGQPSACSPGTAVPQHGRGLRPETAARGPRADQAATARSGRTRSRARGPLADAKSAQDLGVVCHFT